jgi:sugar phosphate isomerase/epimerase
VQLDSGANRVDSFDDARCAAVRASAQELGIKFGLHTLSAVNTAELSPFLSEAADAYLKAYIDVAPKLGAQHIVVHAGYHFTSDRKRRMEVGRERLRRAAAYAEERGALLLLENMNKEPEDAEVHYLAHTVDEWRYYYEEIASPALGLSFTANHAHLVPEGIDGFVNAIPMERVAEVRLADCFRNGKEQHLMLGEGDLDFGAMFALLESKGFKGNYVNAFVSLEAMLKARTEMVEIAREAGVNVD